MLLLKALHQRCCGLSSAGPVHAEGVWKREKKMIEEQA